MSQNRIDSLSVTPTVGKQTQTKEFGEVMRDSLRSGVSALGTVTGLLGGAPGLGAISAAVSSVTSLAGRSTTSNSVVGVGPQPAMVNTPFDSTGVAGGNDMVSQMRAETDRSIAVQMQMQQESRDYNTLSNVLKTRHDTAKAAINNIR